MGVIGIGMLLRWGSWVCDYVILVVWLFIAFLSRWCGCYILAMGFPENGIGVLTICIDTASEEMAADIETENLVVENKRGEDRAVLVVIESDAREVSPVDHHESNASIENKRFEFMVGRKAKGRS